MFIITCVAFNQVTGQLCRREFTAFNKKVAEAVAESNAELGWLCSLEYTSDKPRINRPNNGVC